MAWAVRLARRGPAGGVNPQVGCLILAPIPEESATQRAGQAVPGVAPARSLRRRRRAVLGYGWHQGAGTAHAEVEALTRTVAWGHETRGATAVVTLQPCNSEGRTGPCARALIAAGITRVVYAVADPLARAAASDETLRAAGLQVEGPWTDSAREASELVHHWLASLRLGRPYVTVKTATSLDGRIAATDGTSQWITGAQARSHAHRQRARLGAILVGTTTALVDDPSLTARLPDGTLAPQQPVRVVMGYREIPDHASVRGPGGEFVQMRTHDVDDILNGLLARGVRHLLVEGGGTVAAAFVRAGVVDELQAYLAPMLLGAGPSAIGDCGVDTLSEAPRWSTRTVERLGEDTLLVARREESLTTDEPTDKER